METPGLPELHPETTSPALPPAAPHFLHSPSSSPWDTLVPCYLGSPSLPHPHSLACRSPVLCLVTQSSDSVTPWAVAHWAPLSMRILQARILEWVGMPWFRGSSQPRDQTQVSHISGRFLTISSLKLHLKSHSWGSHSTLG